MKKIVFGLMSICFSLAFYPLQSNAATTASPSSLVVLKPQTADEANAIQLRLNEINAMDKSKLNSSEKQSLRMEVNEFHHRHRFGGVYISVCGLIIITLLLIILLR